MKKIIKSIIPDRVLSLIQNIRKQFSNFQRLAYSYGQWETIKNWTSVDNKGEPIPWYTYPATEFLSHLDLRQFSVLEYGSGNSTLWWAGRVKNLTSIEDDEVWYRKIKNNVDGNCHFLNVKYIFEKQSLGYCNAADNGHDIIVVDGSKRGECIAHIKDINWKGLMLVLDNSDWYPASVKYIQENFGWLQVDFHGLGPINNYTWTTSVFINPERHSEIKYLHPLESKCNVKQIAKDEISKDY